MAKLIPRLLFLLYLFATAFVIYSAFFFQLRPADLPEPVRQEARADGCVVSEEAAQVHNGKSGFENAWIQFVNDDNMVQVTTTDTKLSILFQVEQDEIDCFRKGSIALVTVSECVEVHGGECDFSLPHKVYVRTEPVKVLRWRYKDAS